MNYTKGEWKQVFSTVTNIPNDAEHIVVAANSDPKKLVALTGLSGAKDEEESLANAHLIAAAPDMYLAIQHFLNHNDDGGQPCAICLKRFNKAIAKAEGK